MTETLRIFCPSCEHDFPKIDITEATSLADHGVCWGCNHEMNLGHRCRVCYELGHDINTCPESGIDFDFGAFGDITNHRSMIVYVNRYARQNVRELPCIRVLGGCLRRQYHYKLGKEPVEKYGLGAIWFYRDWLRSLRPYRERSIEERNSLIVDEKVDSDLYVDSDPEWIRFINSICKQCSREGLDLILFYWS